MSTLFRWSCCLFLSFSISLPVLAEDLNEEAIVAILEQIDDPVSLSYTDISQLIDTVEENISTMSVATQMRFKRLMCWYSDFEEGSDYIDYANEGYVEAERQLDIAAMADFQHCRGYNQWYFDLESSDVYFLELELALELAIRVNDALLIGDIRSSFGEIYSYQGDYVNALQAFRSAAVSYLVGENEFSIGYVETEISRTLRRLGDYAQAESYLEKLIPYYQKTGDFLSESSLAIDYGLLWNEQEQYERAIQWYDRAIEIIDEQMENRALDFGDRMDSIAYFYKAESQAMLGEVEGAKTSLKISYDIDGLDLESPEDATTWLILAKISLAEGKPEQAETMVLNAMALNEADDNKRMSVLLLDTLIPALEQQGKLVEALAASKAQRETQKLLTLAAIDQNTRRLSVELALISKEQENDRLKLENVQVELALKNQKQVQQWQMLSIALGGLLFSLLVYRLYVSFRRGQQLEVLATTDSLTGLLNRRSLESAAEKIYNDKGEAVNTLSVILIDIDLFKQVNDNHGHDVGDSVIQGVADLIKQSVRPEDLISRWGGEEYLALLPNASIQNAKVVCERIATNVREHNFASGDAQVQVTVSIGLTERSLKDSTLAQSIRRADKALYEAKVERDDICVEL